MEDFDEGKRKRLNKVEQMLMDVDYGGHEGYIPSDFALDFVNFIKLVNHPDGEQNKSPVIHFKLLDLIARESGSHFANMIFRGSGKTTVMGEYLILYIAVYGKLPKIGRVGLAMYVSDSLENGVKNMRKNLEYRWENSEFLQRYVPQTKFTDNRWEFHNADGRTFIVKGYGATQGIRGVKEMGVRPRLALLDDLVSDDDARSPTVISSIEDTVYKAVDYALDPQHRLVIWLGTPFNQKDPLYKAIASGAWKSNVFPICEEWPCKREEFRGAWEDRFSYDYINEQYLKAKALGRVDTFNQELMLQIMSEDDRLIKDHDIMWYDYERVMKNLHYFNIYITTDFATSEENSADFSVISVWGLNSIGSWYWLDGFCEKVLMDKSIGKLFQLAQKWSPQSVAVEVSGQQKGFIRWIQQTMEDKNIYFTLAKQIGSEQLGIRPEKDKMSRFLTNVVPLFKARKFYFPLMLREHPALVEGINEIEKATFNGFKSKNDDFIDTLNQLPEIEVWRPSSTPEVDEQKEKENEDSFIWGDSLEEEGPADSSYFV